MDNYKFVFGFFEDRIRIGGVVSIQYFIDGDWLPTSKNINALPEPIRKYIHSLDTFSGCELVQKRFELSQNLKGAKELLSMYKELFKQRGGKL